MIIGLAGFAPWLDHSEFNQTRVLELVLLISLNSTLLFNSILTMQAVKEFLPRRPIIKILMVFFWSLGLVSALHSKWPLYALQDWGHYLLFMFAVLAVAAYTHFNPPMTAKIILAGIVAGIALALARFTIQIILTFSMDVMTPLAEWWTPYSNPRFIAQALIWIVPQLTALSAVWPVFQKRHLVTYYTLCSGAWMLLFWTGSRAEILGLAVSIVLIAALMWQQAFPFLARIILNALSGFVLWALTHLALSLRVVGKDSLSLARLGVSGRDWLFNLSMQLAGEHPWLGVGPAHFSAYNHNAIASAHPHNFILQIAAEWGIPAAALLIYLMWKFASHQYSSVRRPLITFDTASNTQYALRIPLLLTLFAVIFTSLLDGVHVMPLSELIGVPILGLIIATSAPSPVSGNWNTRPDSYLGKLIMALVILCLGILMLSVYSQRDCLAYPTRAEQLIGGQVGYDNPRFWAQGRIPLGDGCLEIGRYQKGIDTLTGKSVDASSTTEQYWR